MASIFSFLSNPLVLKIGMALGAALMAGAHSLADQGVISKDAVESVIQLAGSIGMVSALFHSAPKAPVKG